MQAYSVQMAYSRHSAIYTVMTMLGAVSATYAITSQLLSGHESLVYVTGLAHLRPNSTILRPAVVY